MINKIGMVYGGWRHGGWGMKGAREWGRKMEEIVVEIEFAESKARCGGRDLRK